MSKLRFALGLGLAYVVFPFLAASSAVAYWAVYNQARGKGLPVYTAREWAYRAVFK